MSDINTIARPYAKAVFESAVEHKLLEDWSLQLKNLALIVKNEHMLPLLSNPLIAKEELVKLICEIAGRSLNEEGKQLISLLAEKKRLNILPAIANHYENYLAEFERTIDVRVVSAFPIDQTRLQKLQHALQKYLNRQVHLQFDIDNTILGGAIIYANDLVIDGSLRKRLNRLSESLCS